MQNTTHLLKHIYIIAFIGLLISCSPSFAPSGTGQYIPVSDEVSIKSEIEEFLTPYRAALEAEMNVVIGLSEQELTKEGIGESALGNLITDFQKRFAEEALGYTIDISIMNNGGIRNTLPKGEIRLGTIYEISPFDNYLQVLEIDAKSIEDLVLYAARGRNLGISGLTYKVSNGTIQELKINGQAIDPNRSYLIAANDYIANGGDNMNFLVPLKRLEETDTVLRDILINQIKKEQAAGNKIKASIEGRQIIE